MKLWPRTETAVESAELMLTRAQDKRDRLAAQVDQARSELERLKAEAASAALREAPIEVEDTAAAVATSAATCEALTTALAAAEAEIAAAEQALTDARDAELRAESVAELTALVDQIEAAAGPFGDSLADLLAPLQRSAEVNPDCKSIHGFLELVRGDVAQMLNNATDALAVCARNIEGGSAPAKLPRSAPTPVAISAPATTSVCPLHDIRWTDHTGAVRLVAKGWDCPLPPTVAQRALVAGIVVGCEDPRAAKIRRERGSVHADIDRAVDLDQTNPTPPAPPAERWMRLSNPKWEMPSGEPPRAWIAKGQ